MLTQKVLIPLCRYIPALVLNKAIIAAQIHRHRCTAYGAFRNKIGRHFHILLLRHHFAYSVLIVIGFSVTCLGTLP